MKISCVVKTSIFYLITFIAAVIYFGISVAVSGFLSLHILGFFGIDKSAYQGMALMVLVLSILIIIICLSTGVTECYLKEKEKRKKEVL
jgi:amino acid transporter